MPAVEAGTGGYRCPGAFITSSRTHITVSLLLLLLLLFETKLYRRHRPCNKGAKEEEEEEGTL